MSKLLRVYEMARPAGALSAAWRKALLHAKSLNREFTAKEFFQWLQAAGSSAASGASVSHSLKALSADPNRRPDARRPLVIVKAGRQGIGGAAVFRYGYDGPPGIERPDDEDGPTTRVQITKHGVHAIGGEKGGDRNLAFKGSMAPSDKPYFQRRAGIQKAAQAAAGEGPDDNALAAAMDELEGALGKDRTRQMLAHWQKLPTMNAVVNNIFSVIPDDAQGAAMTIAGAMKGAGRDPDVPVGPPSKRPGAHAQPDQPSKARSALSAFMSRKPEPKQQQEPEPEDDPWANFDPSKVQLSDPDAAIGDIASQAPKKIEPKKPAPKDEPEPEEPSDEEEPSEPEDGEDGDEGEFEDEPDDDGDEGWMSPQWLPSPDHAGDRYEAAMARLEDADVLPSDPVWEEISKSNDGIAALKVIRNSKIPESMRSSALTVAKYIFQELGKDWDKEENESWKRSAYSRIVR